MNATALKHFEYAGNKLNKTLWDQATRNANAFMDARAKGQDVELEYTPLNMELALDGYYSVSRDNPNVIVMRDDSEFDFTEVLERLRNE